MRRFSLKGKVAVFIDAANLNIGLRRYRKAVDFKKLTRFFRQQSKNVMFLYYSYDHPNDRRHQGFLTFLKKQGFRLRTKQVKVIRDKRKGEERKANFDVEITIDAVDKQNLYDTMVLFSGDSDFAALVDYLKKKKKQVFACSTRRNISKELWEKARFVDVLSLKQILKPYKNATSRHLVGSGNQ